MLRRVCGHDDRIGAAAASLGHDPLGGIARAGDLAARRDIAALQPGDRARHALMLLLHFSFVGQQPRIRQAEARAPDAGDRKHMHLGPGLLGHAPGKLRRGLRDRAPLRGKDDQFAREGIGRRRLGRCGPRPAQRKHKEMACRRACGCFCLCILPQRHGSGNSVRWREIARDVRLRWQRIAVTPYTTLFAEPSCGPV